jgi:hypothetical protein
LVIQGSRFFDMRWRSTTEGGVSVLSALSTSACARMSITPKHAALYQEVLIVVGR